MATSWQPSPRDIKPDVTTLEGYKYGQGVAGGDGDQSAANSPDSHNKHVDDEKGHTMQGLKRSFSIMKKREMPLPQPETSITDQSTTQHTIVRESNQENVSHAETSDPIIDLASEPESKMLTGLSQSLEDIEDEDVIARRKFRKLEKEYRRKEVNNQLSRTDKITFKRAKNQEDARRDAIKQYRQEQAEENRSQEENDSNYDDGLFVPQPNPRKTDERPEAASLAWEVDDVNQSALPDAAESNNTKTAGIFDGGQKAALELILAKPAKGKGVPKASGKPSKKKTGASNGVKNGRVEKKSAPKKGKGKAKADNQSLASNTLLQGNVFSDSVGMTSKRDQPVFEATSRRKDALDSLIACLPEDIKSGATADRKDLDKACVPFKGRLTYTDEGGFLVTGMKTSLRNYQLMACSWMKRREMDREGPNSGLLADEPGLGKTLISLALIMAGTHIGKSKPSKPRATLIVGPVSLLAQWKSEIAKHCREELEVLVHSAANRSDSNNLERLMESQDIVLTTYSEVSRSYPSHKVPAHLTTSEEKEEWWNEYFETHKGILHKVEWKRIILDEAACIKNHFSHVSIACRGLAGKYRFMLDGAPLHNGLRELYAYFSFMKLPFASTFSHFEDNFGSMRRNAVNVDLGKRERLKVILHKYMLRRSYKDVMFGAPIEKLPEPFSITIYVEFNALERLLYNLVHARIVERMQHYLENEKGIQVRQNMLTLLLRLRQFTSHPFIVRETLLEFLEDEDVQQIKKAIETKVINAGPNNAEILSVLGDVLTQAKIPPDSNQITIRQPQTRTLMNYFGGGPSPTMQAKIPHPGGIHGRKYDLQKYIDDMEAERKKREDAAALEEAKKDPICVRCERRARNPHITSCKHIHCFRCLSAGMLDETNNDADRARCYKCDTPYEKARRLSDLTPSLSADESDGLLQPERPEEGSKKSRKRVNTWVHAKGPMLSSIKTLAIKAQILSWYDGLEEADWPKVIIYVQWQDMVPILEKVCRDESWGCITYQGGHNASTRAANLKQFREDPEINILVASLKAGSVGLNITEATKCIICDMWWNRQIENQAFGRIYRIGQQQQTRLLRIAVRNTVDEKLLRLQHKKMAECDPMLERGAELTSEELLSLFDPTDDEEGPHPNATPFDCVGNSKAAETRLNPKVEKEKEERRRKEEMGFGMNYGRYGGLRYL